MSSSRIARNTTYLTIASIVQKIISFAYFGFLAKAIGESALGKYGFALSFTSIVIIFMDFGLGPLLTREGAKDEKKLQEYLNRLFSIKIILMVLALIGGAAGIHLTALLNENVDALDVRLVYIGFFIIIFDTLTFTLFSIFRAKKHLVWEAMAIVVYQSTILAAGLYFLFRDFPLEVVLSALLAGSIVQFFFLLSAVWRKTDIRFHFTWRPKEVKRLLVLAAPFAVAGLLFRLNGSIDSIMLKTMAGDSYVGWYSLAFKLSFALTVLPGAFATSYFPAISHAYSHAKEQLSEIFENGIAYMLLLAAPIVVGVAILGDDIIYTIWGEDWEASVQALWILAVGLPFIFLNYPVGNFLNAVDRQRLNTVNMGIALLVNIVLNAWLIPVYTFVGAAVAAVASSVVLVVLGLPWVYHVARFRVRRIVTRGARIVAAALFMGFVLFFIQRSYPLLVLIPVGGLIYGAGVLLFGGVSIGDLKQLGVAIRKR